MARISYLGKDDVAEEHRRLLERPIVLPQLLVHSPGALRAFSRLGGYIRSGSRLDPRLREMAILQVGWLARSDYEFSHHCKLGLEEFGVSEDDIRAITTETAGERSGLPELDRTVLLAAREMTEDLGISAPTFERLRQDLDEELTVDLIMAIAFYNGVVRVLASLEIDVEPEYQKYLDQFPFPD